jgi:hypothetical protein
MPSVIPFVEIRDASAGKDGVHVAAPIKPIEGSSDAVMSSPVARQDAGMATRCTDIFLP